MSGSTPSSGSMTGPVGFPSGAQFGRKWQLVYAVGQMGFDLSQLHISFTVNQVSASGAAIVPGMCTARIYNLSAATVNKIRTLSPNLLNGASVPNSSEHARLIIQAGYQNGNYGVVFDGQVIQLTSGKETNVDTFLEVTAATFDAPYIFGVVNKTLAPGASGADVANAVAQAMQPHTQVGQTIAASNGITGGVLPRGKVLWGMGHDYLQELGATTGTQFINQNGTLTPVPLTGYLPGEALVVNSSTGMIGIPQLTQNGLEVTILLNAKVSIGTRIQVSQKDLTSSQLTGVTPQINPASTRFASFAADGFYRVLSVDHSGDTRGDEWYTKIVALAVDPSANPNASVLSFG
jgi:hypothetical protein